MQTVLLLCLVAVVSTYAAELLRAGDQKAGDDTYIIVLRHDKTRKKRDVTQFSDTLSRQYGVNAFDEVHIGNFDAIYVKGDEEHINGLLNIPDIDYVEENKKGEFDAQFCWESNKITKKNWGVHRLSRRNAVPSCPHPDCVYKYGSDQDGEGVYVYVLDSGIRLDHEEFNNRAIFGKQFRNQPKTDLLGHGTHVAGIAIGKNYGVARGAMAVAVQVGDGSRPIEIDVIKGVEWAHNDIKKHKRKAVINISLSFGRATESLNTAIKEALAENTPFVLTASNQGIDACVRSPAILGKTTNAITVGATDITDELRYSSNFGDCVTMLAPGGEIHAAGIDSKEGITIKSGTSMAAPHVSGVIARYLSGFNDMQSPASIKKWLLDSATPNKITLPEKAKLKTPNKLLYMDCTHPQVKNEPPIIYRKANVCTPDDILHKHFCSTHDILRNHMCT